MRTCLRRHRFVLLLAALAAAAQPPFRDEILGFLTLGSQASPVGEDVWLERQRLMDFAHLARPLKADPCPLKDRIRHRIAASR
jgi:hypothetical protein